MLSGILIGLGANRAGPWGGPREAIERAILELQQAGLVLLARSRGYRTKPVGPLHQPDFVNAVARFSGSFGPAALLRLAKALERRAGRGIGPRGGPRPLDVDILAFGGRCIGCPSRRRAAGRLLLPHPEMCRRGFVLVPLAEVAPGWRHPARGLGARDMLRRAPHLRRGVARLEEQGA
jgi:2-amino-4-hydroxy-6-hydroxymethyldihydropteridine diphosphokinase